MTTVKFTTPTAAGAEVDARAMRHMAEKGTSYREAVNVVLGSDKQLAEAYAAPAARRVRMATTDARSKPAISVPVDVEREILDWVSRAVRDGMASSLSGV